MIYVSSDWHGIAPAVIAALLSQAKFSDGDTLYVLGDVIDRGEHGVTHLKWLMAHPNTHLLLGNHEDMLLSCDFLFREGYEAADNRLTPSEMTALHTWKYNGAAPTLAALRAEPPAVQADLLAYLRRAPLYEAVQVSGRRYVLTHAGLTDAGDDSSPAASTAHDLLWTRPSLETRYSSRFTTILGHTPTGFYGSSYRGRILKTETWWDIDTGAAGGLAPMLLCLDTLEEFYCL